MQSSKIRAPTWQRLEALVQNLGATQLQVAHGFTEERRLPFPRFNHRQRQLWADELQRNRRRSAPGTEVDPAARRESYRGCGRKRFDKQAIECKLVRRVQPERRQVDRSIPAGKQAVVGLNLVDFRVGHHNADPSHPRD